MGARLLRSNILQPPADLATIETRLKAVDGACDFERKKKFFFMIVLQNYF